MPSRDNKMRKAFTLMELVVALAILAVVLSFAGVIFRVSIDSHRLALANAEIMQKLRVITDQLDADFRSLRKDGEIFIVWAAEHKRQADYPQIDPNDMSDPWPSTDSTGSCSSRLAISRRTAPIPSGATWPGSAIRWRGARRPPPRDEPNVPQMQKPHKRILARTQHILVPRPGVGTSQLDTSKFTTADWVDWNSHRQIDQISLEGWKRIPLAEKVNMLSVIGDITIEAGGRISAQHDRRRRPAGF